MSVYFVTCREANAVKIGSSNDPVARLGEIQWGCPLLLKLEAVIPGDQEQEFELHRRFADHRIRGEWFHITDIIELMMAQVPTPEQPKKAVARIKSGSPKRRNDPHAAYVASVHRAELRKVRRLVTTGDIHFPFRELAALEEDR